MSYRLELEPEDVPDDRGPARRRWPAVVVVALLVMAGSAAGLWAAYRVIGRHGAGGPVPILRADERPAKVAPANPGGMTVPDQDMYILNDERPADSRVEQLLPPPETPLPRPTPSEPVVTETPAPVATPGASAPALGAVTTTEPVPAVAAPALATGTTAETPAAAPAVAALPPPHPAVAAPVAAATPPAPVRAPAETVTPAAAGAAGYRLQVGAVRSAEAAQTEWTRLKRTEPDLLGSLAAQSRRIDLGERGVFYRIEVGPIADAAAAARTCDELKRRKVGCIVVKP